MVSYWVVALLCAALFVALFVVPVRATYAAASISCGPAIFFFIPNDLVGITGREYEEYMACRRDGTARVALVFGIAIAAGIAGVVHGRRFKRTAVRSAAISLN